MALTAERKYRLLVELSQRISRTLDLGAVLDDLLQALRSAIAYDAAGVFVLNRAVPLRADGNLIAGMVQPGPMCRSGPDAARPWHHWPRDPYRRDRQRARRAPGTRV
jgi:hypothetical protein